MHLYFNWQGRPISAEQWHAEMRRNRRVALTDLGKLGHVSTVYLGLNHAFDDGPPLIFETMCFGGPLDGILDRYSNAESARIGHEFTVMRLTTLRDTVKQPPLIHNGRKPRK